MCPMLETSSAISASCSSLPTSYGHPGMSPPLPQLHTLAGAATVVVADAVYPTDAAAAAAPYLSLRPLPEPPSKSLPRLATLPVIE